MATNASLKRDGVRERLLEAAGQVFAERGFRDGTIQEICRRAGANIAAVNYYFGDKRNLYVEVFRYAHRARAREADKPPDPEAPAEEQLRQFVRSFLGSGCSGWCGAIIQRETTEPTGLLSGVFKQEIRPRHERLAAIVRALAPAPLPREQVLFCVFSILGQCLFYSARRPVLTRLYPELHLDAPNIDLLADHITRFTVAALKNLTATGRNGKQ